jgi:hypothetical protein
MSDPVLETERLLFRPFGELDEDFLRAEGVTDFSGYVCAPGTDPPRISWASATTPR